MEARIETLVVGPFGVNCFLVFGERNSVIVIDPGADAERIADCLTSARATVACYLITHGHVDHISALAEMEALFPAPIGIHPLESKWAFSRANHMLPFYGPPRKPSAIERELQGNQIWTDAGLRYKVLFTPGHSPGAVCFYFESLGVVFTGDTLFAGSVGRTDLPGGDARTLAASLKHLKCLPPDTRVFPGHGPATTIAAEKATNYFLRGCKLDET